MREDIREKNVEIKQLMTPEGSLPLPRKNVKKAMKLSQQRVKLVQKLNLRELVVAEMHNFYGAATLARRMGITCENDPDIFKQEALKYAKLFGDDYLHLYNAQLNK